MTVNRCKCNEAIKLKANVKISTVTCIHSRAILLKKELMNPLLQNIRQNHLNSVNKGKLPQKLQLIRCLCRRNSFPRLSAAISASKDNHQKVVKGSLRQDKPPPPQPFGDNIAQSMKFNVWLIRNPAFLPYSKLQCSFRFN